MSKDNKDGIDFEQTEGLIKNESEKNRLITLISIFIAFSLFLTIHAVKSIFEHWTDDSIPLVMCPKDFNLDTPVLLNPINQTDDFYKQDRWIRGFVRKVVLNSYPRTADDAETFFKYMESISESDVKRKYSSFLNDMSDIIAYIKAGSSIRFYPKSSGEMRIRLAEGRKDRWVVEVDGFLVKNAGTTQERTTPTLRYVIEARKATRDNPAGLVVVEAQTELFADYVSGRKKQEEPSEKK